MKECSLNHIHLTDDELLGDYKWKGDLDLFNVVMIGLTNDLPEKKEDYEMHRLLGALLSMNMSVDERLNVLTQEYNIGKDEETERRLSEMCNLSDGVMEYGMEIGRKESSSQIVLNMYRQKCSPEQISKFTGINLDKVQDIIRGADVMPN